METLTKIDKLLNFIENKYSDEEINSTNLVEVIKLCGQLLNLKNIPTYCKDNNISYEGARKYRNVIILFGNKFIIDNE